jgi:serine/threonine-protein kinase RsbT
MALRRTERLPIQTEMDIVRVRQAVRRWATECRFSLIEQTKLVTAASELARNALEHGKGGEAMLEEHEHEPGRGAQRGIRVTFVDNGPGIADIQQALQDGYTTGSGMGHGLGGARRLVDEFHIESSPDRGTKVTIGRWR